jgi:tricorn protease
MLTRRFCYSIFFLATFAATAGAQEPIKLARTPDISPDGKLVAFSYFGDIWVADTVGGVARPVTSHRAHEINPVFSPDGKWIAFSSNRHGSYNVFIIPVESGKPRRLTFDSSNEMVTGWSPDGKSVLFTSTRTPTWPVGLDLYTVPVEGGRPHRITTTEGREGVFSPDGKYLAYVRGPGAWYRKGYRGSSNDDIWICEANGTNNRQLTAFNGQDNSPMWSADGHWIYYVSEFHGTPANVVRLLASAALGPVSERVPVPQQITFHKHDGVRKARIASSGEWIVYECGSDLYVVSTKDGAKPRKLLIEVRTDDKSNTERQETFTNNATEFTVAPDDQHVIFGVHGELFLLPVRPGAKPVRMTHSKTYNRGAQWAPDGSKAVFLSDQDGHDNVYLLEADDPEHPKFVEARRFKSLQLTHFKEAASAATFSPDGKRISFIRAGRLFTMNPDGTDQKEVVGQGTVIDYEWAPDSKWLVYARMDGSFASELYVIPATGATADQPAHNVTRYATYNAGVTWSADGKYLAFLSNRRGNAEGLFVLPLQKPAAPGVPEKTPASPAVEFDWDDLHLRAKSITTMPVAEAAISPDGKRIAFSATVQGSTDLWVANTDGNRLMRMTANNQRPKQITWSKRKIGATDYVDVVYYRDHGGAIKMLKLGNEAKPDNSHVATIGFQVKMNVRADEEFTEMFDQSWRYLSENFYDVKFHGADWDAVRAKYRPLVQHVTMKEDLFYLLYLMMGELNASHLGINSVLSTPEEPTAHLGLLFEESYRGKGLKIAEVIKRGPADKRGLNLKPGEFVMAIDDVEIAENTDLSTLLNGKVNESISLTVAPAPEADAKSRRRVSVQGAELDQVRVLLYDRWVEHNARRVAEVSKGKLGYIHIPGMDEEGLDRFVRALYSDNFDKEAIVLDVRYNGGGFTHDQVLNYLGGREHTIFRQRNGGEGWVLRAYDRKWTKPVVLLINNRSYSDAEIFPNAFRSLGLGKLVGQPTGGQVIGTGGVRLIDGSLFRVPRIGVYTTKGVNMDKEGVVPDVLVEPHPDQLAKGLDPQLDRAIEVLLADVAEWKKKNPSGVAVKPESPVPAPVPMPKAPPEQP